MEIKNFQRIIRQTYGHRDRARGLWSSFAWLIEEIGELARALRSGDPDQINREFADVAAWLFSVADLAGIDMEKALARYEKGCPRCGQNPCVCQHRQGQ